MKLFQLTFYMILVISILGCKSEQTEASFEKWKEEIVDTEHAFAAMAKAEGIPEAFLAYAAEDAVLMRNNNLVKGKKEMADFFENQSPGGGELSLSWEPDFVDVARSGDLGYTYGKFVFSMTDSTGVTRENAGVFHTVWKRQADGSWKFVWD
ncbi:MAG: DUF4440 domain-containing protein [Flavobacteriaceae bacterium]|nr:DUF4440 domain-containing protein [Eudoraea sp.]NNJ38610.1 DUF4440 domain-containing protein [Flavobacteriaceae bacterium]